MKTWLKGGLIGLGIIVAIFVINVLIGGSHPFSGEGSMFLFLLASFPFVKIFSLLDNQYPNNLPLSLAIYIIVTFIAYFLSGALIGLIVGKIKSTSQE